MSATTTFIPAGLSSIAVSSAARLNEPLRRLPQMPSTEIAFTSLIGLSSCSSVSERRHSSPRPAPADYRALGQNAKHQTQRCPQGQLYAHRSDPELPQHRGGEILG